MFRYIVNRPEDHDLPQLLGDGHGTSASRCTKWSFRSSSSLEAVMQESRCVVRLVKKLGTSWKVTIRWCDKSHGTTQPAVSNWCRR